MENANHIEIQLSKTKILLLLLGSAAFVAIGFWFVIIPPQIKIPLIALKIFGAVCVLFFGLTGLVSVRKLVDNTPGLIINDEGITDNSSGISAGLIPWRDIADISVLEIGHQKMIMIEVINPQKYIDRQPNTIQKKAVQFNLNNYGSPISISANTLKCSFDELLTLIKSNIERHIN